MPARLWRRRNHFGYGQLFDCRRQNGGTMDCRRSAMTSNNSDSVPHHATVTNDASGPKLPPLSQVGPVMLDCSQPCAGKPETEVP